MSDMPLITALMVTGKSPDRRPLAAAAVRSFLQQTYPRKRLVIVDDSPPPYWEADCLRHPEVTVVRATPRPLGALRNLGLELISEGLTIQWDDDDWSHPERISCQWSFWSPGRAVTLLWQVRYSFINNAAYAIRYDKRHQGIPGTALFDPMTNPAVRYNADDRKHEDSHLLDKWFPGQCVVYDNNWQHNPGPEMYLRFCHPTNTWSERHIMRDYSGEDRRNVRDLTPQQNQYLEHVLRNHYGRVSG